MDWNLYGVDKMYFMQHQCHHTDCRCVDCEGRLWKRHLWCLFLLPRYCIRVSCRINGITALLVLNCRSHLSNLNPWTFMLCTLWEFDGLRNCQGDVTLPNRLGDDLYLCLKSFWFTWLRVRKFRRVKSPTLSREEVFLFVPRVLILRRVGQPQVPSIKRVRAVLQRLSH